MNKKIVRRAAQSFAVLALLAAGYLGMQLAPTIHATANAVSHSQVAWGCPSVDTHC